MISLKTRPQSKIMHCIASISLKMASLRGSAVSCIVLIDSCLACYNFLRGSAVSCIVLIDSCLACYNFLTQSYTHLRTASALLTSF